ncbi:hypothetical protein BaRGS_00028940 [Batillaria attramentaria]|uniref:Uncharacterized protein n=1 Tax=Batillaria attramentaria TaxID=370345 RepID=A0ABD0JZ65_9CAEN
MVLHCKQQQMSQITSPPLQLSTFRVAPQIVSVADTLWDIVCDRATRGQVSSEASFSSCAWQSASSCLMTVARIKPRRGGLGNQGHLRVFRQQRIGADQTLSQIIPTSFNILHRSLEREELRADKSAGFLSEPAEGAESET